MRTYIIAVLWAYAFTALGQKPYCPPIVDREAALAAVSGTVGKAMLERLIERTPEKEIVDSLTA